MIPLVFLGPLEVQALSGLQGRASHGQYGNDQPHLSGPIWKLVHDGSLVHRDDGFWGRCAVAQCVVWSFRAVVRPPLLDQYLRLLEAVKDFPVQHFMAEASIEPLAVTIFPR